MKATIHYDECYILLINNAFQIASVDYDDVVLEAQQQGFDVEGGTIEPPTITYML